MQKWRQYVPYKTRRMKLRIVVLIASGSLLILALFGILFDCLDQTLQIKKARKGGDTK